MDNELTEASRSGVENSYWYVLLSSSSSFSSIFNRYPILFLLQYVEPYTRKYIFITTNCNH